MKICYRPIGIIHFHSQPAGTLSSPEAEGVSGTVEIFDQYVKAQDLEGFSHHPSLSLSSG